MVDLTVWDATVPPGVQNAENAGDVMEVANVFYIPTGGTDVYICTGAKVYFSADTLTALGAAGVTSLDVSLRKGLELSNIPLRITNLSLPGAAGWAEINWAPYVVYDLGSPLVIGYKAVGPGTANQYYFAHPSPGTASVASVNPASPVRLSASAGGATWGMRSLYRLGEGGTNNGGGFLYGVDIIMETNNAPAVIDYDIAIKVDGWLRTTANTGLAGVGVNPEVDLTPWDGPMLIDGYCYRRDIVVPPGELLALKDNAVLHECRITTSADPGVRFMGDNRVISCDLIINDLTAIQRVGFHAHPYYGATSVQVRNVLMTGGTIHMWFDVEALVEDFYGYNQMPETGGQQHRDGYTRRGGVTPQIIRRSRFDCDEDATTGAFFLQNTFGDPVANVSVEDSMFEGSGYCLTLEDATGTSFNNLRINPKGLYSFGPLTRTSNFAWTLWQEVYLYDALGVDYKGDVIDIASIPASDAGGPGTGNPYGDWYSDGVTWHKL